ncbi:MAG: phosphoribosylglycinamide formyltransferase [Cytophagaceae bacterium]|nr:phosphoribosylglycinamide formyltransferase [Cytophagaceae bacterium]
MTNIAILASGSGSNAQKIMEYFKSSPDISINVLLSNNKNAYALERAKNFGIPTRVFDRKSFCDSDEIVNELTQLKTDWIILAGFLWLIPQNLIKAFPGRIINIHPALLPAYGGKGMYGKFVHEAVVAAGEKETGISIHMVNEKYDEGKIIFQARCCVDPGDTADMVAQKVQTLEHEHFPRVIEEFIKKTGNWQ